MNQPKNITALCPLLHRSKNRSPTLFRLYFILLLNLTVYAVGAVNETEIAVDLSPIVRIYKDGSVERLMGTQTVPAGFDNETAVDSKDVVFSLELGLSARIYIPKIYADANPSRKLPIVVYIHGGGFVVESATSPTYHNYLNIQVFESEIVVVSVDYRRVPEHRLPAAYGDSWAALKWVASHSGGNGPERWVNDHADLNRLFLAGDSAGANIAHRMGVISGTEEIGGGVNLAGIVLIDPYFLGLDPVGGEQEETRALLAGIWFLAYPTTVGLDDPWINPDKDPDLKTMGCEKVLVCLAGNDPLRYRDRHYYEVLKASGWVGSVEIFESDGEDHVFFLNSDPMAEKAVELRGRISTFINQY